MGNLVQRVRKASDIEFENWLATVTESDRVQLLAMRDAMKKRDEYMLKHDGRYLPFMTTAEKMNFIETCYGWVFAVIEREFPIAARNPEEVTSFTWHIVNVNINHLFLPEDQKMLMLA